MRSHDTSTGSLRFSVPMGVGGLAICLLGCGFPGQDVHGRAVHMRVAEDGSGPTETTNWTGRTIEALSPSAGASGRLSAEVDAQGEFTIPEVPAGPFWLAFPDEVTAINGDSKIFVWTEARELDLGYNSVGSPFVATAYRHLPIEITGLLPTQEDDHMEVYPTSRHWSTYWGLTGAGADKTTWPAGSPIKLRESPGERLLVKQWRRTIQDGVISETTVRAGSVPVPDETTSSLSIPLADIATRTLDLRIDAAAFAAELAPLPRPSSGWWGFALNAVALPKEPMSPSDRLLSAFPKDPARDANLSGISYADPHPDSPMRRYVLSFMSGRTYAVPGDSTLRASCGTGLRLVGDASALANSTLRPRLSLPQALEIDGTSAMNDLANVSRSPTVRWQPPRLGQVSFYMLKLYRIAKLPDRGTPEISAGTFITTQTQITLPEGVLQPGVPHFLDLIAVSATDLDAKTAPRRASLLEYTVDTAHLCSAGLRLAS